MRQECADDLAALGFACEDIGLKLDVHSDLRWTLGLPAPVDEDANEDGDEVRALVNRRG
jgi:hypothetical protein